MVIVDSNIQVLFIIQAILWETYASYTCMFGSVLHKIYGTKYIDWLCVELLRK